METSKVKAVQNGIELEFEEQSFVEKGDEEASINESRIRPTSDLDAVSRGNRDEILIFEEYKSFDSRRGGGPYGFEEEEDVAIFKS